MTARQTALPAAHARSSARVRAPRFAGLAWVAWRQQRAGLAVLAVLAAGLTALLAVFALHDRTALAAITRAHCTSFATEPCNSLINRLPELQTHWLDALAVLPALAGVFIAAPLFCRGYENGSFRFAVTQGVRRTRWALPQLLVPAAAGVVICVVPALAERWLIDVYNSGSPVVVAPVPPWDPVMFSITPLLLPCWFLLALAAGTLAGVAFRRTVPAMAVTLAAAVGAVYLVDIRRVLPNALLPVATRTARLAAPLWSQCTGPAGAGLACSFPDPVQQPYGNGMIVHGWFTHAGHALSVAQSSQVASQVPRTLVAAGSASGEKRAALAQWLAAHGYTYWISYQPMSHYGLLQAITAAILVALAVALAAVALWIMRRRAA